MNENLCICISVLHFFFVSFQANIGQDEDFDAARKKAESLGAKKVRKSMRYVTNVIMFPHF